MERIKYVIIICTFLAILLVSVSIARQPSCPACQKNSPADYKNGSSCGEALENETDSLPKDIILNSIGMKLKYIKPGEYMMGRFLPAKEVAAKYGGEAKYFQEEEPLHWVVIGKGFWMGQTEVTRGQFRKFVDETGYETTAERRNYGGGMSKVGWAWIGGLNWRSAGIPQTDEHPVVQVSWDDAMAFCQWLSKKESRQYRLPTEAELEYACRAGTETVFFWGDIMEDGKAFANMAEEAAERWINSYSSTFPDYCKWDDGYANTAPVGSFRPNAWGLYDMHGNISEWCSDWYDENYYLKSPSFDPIGPSTGTFRALRGGSWLRNPGNCRSAYRSRLLPDFRSIGRGFRVVLSYFQK